jgi:hypothetical protein
MVTDSTQRPNPSDMRASYVRPMSVVGAAPATLAIVSLRWPAEADRRRELAAEGIPRLLLVAPGARPPSPWELDEDWIAEDAPLEDRRHRERTLRQRLALVARPGAEVDHGLVVDDDGLVRRGGRWVALTDLELRLVRPLVAAPGRCVSRAVLLEAGWPGEARATRIVDGAIRRLRAKLRPLDVAVHGITGVGYLLEVGAGPVP